MNCACTDLCGGRLATVVPTAINVSRTGFWGADALSEPADEAPGGSVGHAFLDLTDAEFG